MDNGTLGAREQTARERVAAVAGRLATKLGVEADLVNGLSKPHRDPRYKALFRLEALVPVLEAIETAVTANEPTRAHIAAIVLEIPGLTKTSKEAIKAWSSS